MFFEYLRFFFLNELYVLMFCVNYSYSPEELHAMVDLKPEKKEDDWEVVMDF